MLKENERLKRASTSGSRSPLAAIPVAQTVEDEAAEIEASDIDAAVANPLMKERAWFVPYDANNHPAYIGEAACMAFATRFRQAIDVSRGLAPAVHVLRANYMNDQELLAASGTTPMWPSKTRAQLLVKIALSHVGRSYYVGLSSITLAKLEEAYANPNFNDRADTCKLFVLFAMGEVYSGKAKSHEQGFPGLSYFVYANSLAQMFPERARLRHIECMLLLSFFSYNLNRRNSAYLWIGTALRVSMSLGLHHNLPQTTKISAVQRQHRVRLWWTVYICDRMWGSKLGQPLAVRDDDITVDLPSMEGLTQEEGAEFFQLEYLLARISLAKITGDLIRTIYTRGKSPPFVQSVRQILRDLNSWMATLPDSIRLNQNGRSTERHLLSLHLSFNQSVILATRPVLLYVFERSKSSPHGTPASVQSGITSITSTLAEACIHAAKHSAELLLQGWIEGILSTFGYFDAQYLFSSATILSISSLLSDSSARDQERLESITHLLQSMTDSGNLSAADFSSHLGLVRNAIQQYRATTTDEVPSNGVPVPDAAPLPATTNPMGPLTTEMALLEPPIQDFLSLSDVTFDFPNVVDHFDNFSPMYSWPHD